MHCTAFGTHVFPSNGHVECLFTYEKKAPPTVHVQPCQAKLGNQS